MWLRRLLVSAALLQVSSWWFPAGCSQQSLAEGLHQRVIFPGDILWTCLITLVSQLSPTLLLRMPVPYFGAFPRFSLQAQFCSPTAIPPSRDYVPTSGSTPWTRCRLLVARDCGQQGWGLPPTSFLQGLDCAVSGTLVAW